MAGAQHVERAVDLLLARIDQGDEVLRPQTTTPHGFAQRFDDGLRARLAGAGGFGDGLAPPFQSNARQHRLARDRCVCEQARD